MTIRKCIYTGKEAESKDNVVPKKLLNEDEVHNWANKAPVSKEYKDLKRDKMPSEIEMELNRMFHKLELARIDVQYYELKIKEFQGIINEGFDKVIEKKVEKKKDKEIKACIKEKEILEDSESLMDELLEEKAKFWE